MEYFFGWIIFSLVIGFVGSGRKIGFLGAFFLSLILSPVISLIITLFSKDIADEKYKQEVLKTQQEQQQSLEKITGMNNAPPSSEAPSSEVSFNKALFNEALDEVIKLKEMKDDGKLTETEFEKAKNVIIELKMNIKL